MRSDMENAMSSVPEQRPRRSVLREITADDLEDLDTVALLHVQLLDFGPMSALGFRFVRDVCYRMLLADGVLRLALYEVDGQPAGFVAYTSQSVQFHRVSLRKHWPAAGWAAVRAIIEDPRRLHGLLRTLRVLRSRRTHQDEERDPLGEVVCLAARPEYLNSRFVRQTGLRVSEELELYALDCLRRLGVDRARMIVDADNKRALLLHHRLGGRFERSELGGAPQLEVWFDLTGHSSVE
jgi:hypothetical protein